MTLPTLIEEMRLDSDIASAGQAGISPCAAS